MLLSLMVEQLRIPATFDDYRATEFGMFCPRSTTPNVWTLSWMSTSLKEYARQRSGKGVRHSLNLKSNRKIYKVPFQQLPYIVFLKHVF